MLEQLRQAKQPITLDQLRASGIDFPAVVIGEPELKGYVIERVYEQGMLLGVRLLETEAPLQPHANMRDSHAAIGSGRCSTTGEWQRVAASCSPPASPIEERTRCSLIWPLTRRSAYDASRGTWKSPGASARRRNVERMLRCAFGPPTVASRSSTSPTSPHVPSRVGVKTKGLGPAAVTAEPSLRSPRCAIIAGVAAGDNRSVDGVDPRLVAHFALQRRRRQPVRPKSRDRGTAAPLAFLLLTRRIPLVTPAFGGGSRTDAQPAEGLGTLPE
jgi:hypothetical protein